MCSAGCECTHCTNNNSTTPVTEKNIPSNDDIDDIMVTVFGEEESDLILDQENDSYASDEGSDEGSDNEQIDYGEIIEGTSDY